jgi:hypothetical protein
VGIEGPGREQLNGLSRRLRDAGPEGRGLYRALQKALKKAADPVAKEIGDTAHMDPYMPNRYAAVLAADLDVKVRTSLSGDPKVTIEAKAREHHRKIGLIEDGVINHPVFARGPRRAPRSPALRGEAARKHGIPLSAVRGWTWKNGQTAGMRAGFFAEPCENSESAVRDRLLEAMAETERKITDGR